MVVAGPGLEVDDAVLAPLMLLHRLLAVELLPADVALKGSVIPMGSLMNLNSSNILYVCMYIMYVYAC